MSHVRMNQQMTEEAIQEFRQMLQEAGTSGLRTVDFSGTKHFYGRRTLTANQIRRVLKLIPGVKCDEQQPGWPFYHRSWYWLPE